MAAPPGLRPWFGIVEVTGDGSGGYVQLGLRMDPTGVILPTVVIVTQLLVWVATSTAMSVSVHIPNAQLEMLQGFGTSAFQPICKLTTSNSGDTNTAAQLVTAQDPLHLGRIKKGAVGSVNVNFSSNSAVKYKLTARGWQSDREAIAPLWFAP